jgi:hypothetical protein
MDLAQHHDGVQGPIQLPISAPVEAMADDLAGRRLDRGRPSQHGESGLGPESAWMGPADQQLGGVDGTDAGLGHQGRGHDRDELAQLRLQLLGVVSGGQGSLGGQAECLDGGAVLHRIAGGGDRPTQAWSCWRQGRPRRLSRSGSGAVMIRALSWRRASAPAATTPARVMCSTRSASRCPALARGGEGAGQGFAAGPDGVQGVALGGVAAPGPLGPVDLDHPLALVNQQPGQPGPIAPGPF